MNDMQYPMASQPMPQDPGGGMLSQMLTAPQPQSDPTQLLKMLLMMQQQPQGQPPAQSMAAPQPEPPGENEMSEQMINQLLLQLLSGANSGMHQMPGGQMMPNTAMPAPSGMGSAPGY